MRKVIKLKLNMKPKNKTSRKNAKKSGKAKAGITRANKFYITTAIPYVNANPHIGHALEFIQTDCIRRYYALKGINTFLTTGADENSLKNVQAAESEGITTQQLCDRNAAIYKKLADALLSYDSFLRSSSQKEHWPGVQKLWKLCKKDIYKKKYRGLYCVGCEAFYTESELKDGLCPEHLRKPEEIEEENYFFKLSKYQEKLTKLIESDKIKIVPETRKHEVLSFIKSGLEDFSISRSMRRAKGWGVPIPGDKEQIIYVWFDALNVYQTAIGFGKNEKLYKKLWPCNCHVIGKGIIRFHAVYWPAILLSAGLKLPKNIFVHGYVTVNGQKMSKTIGNVVDPFKLIEKYGADRLRYFMLQLPVFDDGDFSEKQLIDTTNNELVSNYSNLFYRVTYFIEKNYNGIVPEYAKSKDAEEMEELLAKTVDAAEKHMEEYRLNEALKDILHLVGESNKYFQSKKPWETLGTKDCGTALYVSVNILRTIATLLYPFIPESSEVALNALDIKEKKWSQLKRFTIKPGHKIKSEMLFRKIEHKESETKEERIKTAERIEENDIYSGIKPRVSVFAEAIQKRSSIISSAKETIRVVDGMIPFNEFKKLDLRIGTVTEVKDHPNADKLYIIQVDLGSEKRQIVAGLKGIYSRDELKGKQISVICNLEPAELRGVKSEGMLLAADDGTLLITEKKVKNGVKVR